MSRNRFVALLKASLTEFKNCIEVLTTSTILVKNVLIASITDINLSGFTLPPLINNDSYKEISSKPCKLNVELIDN
jgi:hypothetical protein